MRTRARGAVVVGNNTYYNYSDAAVYVGMSDTGFRRGRARLGTRHGIVIPVLRLPVSGLEGFIDKRVLDVYRQPYRKGQDQVWLAELKKVCELVNAEFSASV